MEWEELVIGVLAVLTAAKIFAWGERRLKPLDKLFERSMNSAADFIEHTMSRAREYLEKNLPQNVDEEKVKEMLKKFANENLNK